MFLSSYMPVRKENITKTDSIVTPDVRVTEAALAVAEATLAPNVALGMSA